jgi:DNA mismatch repair protein MutH
MIRTVKELMTYLDRMVGVPFEEILSAVPSINYEKSTPQQRKSLAGRVVETLLGEKANSRMRADLRSLGIEVKSIPLELRGPTNGVPLNLTAREPTAITSGQAVFDDLSSSWRETHLFEKLRAVLWVPIMKHDLERYEGWYIRQPFVWMPSEDEERQLREDFEGIKDYVYGALKHGLGKPDQMPDMDRRNGLYLRLGTKAKDATTRKDFNLAGVGTFREKPRAWYIRPALTNQLIAQNVRLRLDSIEEASSS